MNNLIKRYFDALYSITKLKVNKEVGKLQKTEEKGELVKNKIEFFFRKKVTNQERLRNAGLNFSRKHS